jgi:hypothetical protein
MGLGPPSCKECRVYLILDDKPKGRGWYCPVCESDEVRTSYDHIYGGHIYEDSMVPFLRFMKGKKPNEVD